MSGLWFTTMWHVCLIWSELSLSHCLSLVTLLHALSLLYFAWVVDDAKCVLVTHICLSVCLSVPCRIPTLLHRSGCNLAEWYGVPSSCALLGWSAINAQVRCYDNIVPNMKCQQVLALAVWLVIIMNYQLCWQTVITLIDAWWTLMTEHWLLMDV